MNELFPAEAVAMDSPRLAWMKRHDVRIHHSPTLCPDSPFCVWLPSNDAYPDLGAKGVPNNPSECGYGITEGDALEELAKLNGLKLWNEEPTA